MKLSRRSWIVRYAYFMDEPVPYRTSLCALFWRCVALTTLKGALVVLLTPVVFPIVGISVLVERRRQRRLQQGISTPTLAERWEESSTREVFSAIKHRVCPLIELSEK